MRLRLLLIPQRYEFSSKSQQGFTSTAYWLSCCWYHKGTNFQANHNMAQVPTLLAVVVADTTKVRIFKQITTLPLLTSGSLLLLLIPQRYEFSSKSQPVEKAGKEPLGCCWYHKGTNFQANHNLRLILTNTPLVVADTTKVRIFKQITTTIPAFDARKGLLLIPQRYEFSSKSQQTGSYGGKEFGCCWYHKGTNFQANHNVTWFSMRNYVVVADTTKVRIFKQITTVLILLPTYLLLLLIPQRYEFSSKSQPGYSLILVA